MGAQQDRLAEVLRDMGFIEDDKPQRPKLAAMTPEAQEQVVALYRALGGVLTDPPLATGAWDSAYNSTSPA